MFGMRAEIPEMERIRDDVLQIFERTFAAPMPFMIVRTSSEAVGLARGHLESRGRFREASIAECRSSFVLLLALVSAFWARLVQNPVAIVETREGEAIEPTCRGGARSTNDRPIR
jgi:hypothetical protein